jgi:hypothetical protein
MIAFAAPHPPPPPRPRPRSYDLVWNVAGLAPVGGAGVTAGFGPYSGVENVDLTGVVRGHLEYPARLDAVMQALQWPGLAPVSPPPPPPPPASTGDGDGAAPAPAVATATSPAASAAVVEGPI